MGISWADRSACHTALSGSKKFDLASDPSDQDSPNDRTIGTCLAKSETLLDDSATPVQLTKAEASGALLLLVLISLPEQIRPHRIGLPNDEGRSLVHGEGIEPPTYWV